MHGNYKTCDIQMKKSIYKNTEEIRASDSLFEKQFGFLHKLIFCVLIILGVMGEINAKIRRKERTDLRECIAAVVNKSTRR